MIFYIYVLKMKWQVFTLCSCLAVCDTLMQCLFLIGTVELQSSRVDETKDFMNESGVTMTFADSTQESGAVDSRLTCAEETNRNDAVLTPTTDDTMTEVSNAVPTNSDNDALRSTWVGSMQVLIMFYECGQMFISVCIF